MSKKLLIGLVVAFVAVLAMAIYWLSHYIGFVQGL